MRLDEDRQFIAEADLAFRYGKAVRTLQRWRAKGYGPTFMRIGGSIFYRLEDIEEFEARMRRGGGSQ
ncbi:helix-turn-helix transcriptional regulator [Tabrizicola aquatica]|jgi:hypothetical protein|uniref:helix-turn-helix transcriptional regulator n=1 Tax=Tabrizicola aquatica TaxID=909926 RepID=UPI000CD17D4E|nr:helix-turn-helix domain-containing protein [Tabrizicola aquatica]